MKRVIALMFLTSFFASSALAEDLDKIFQKVQDLEKAGNYSAALNELQWASKELQKRNMNKLKDFFPDTLAGLSGSPATSNSAMGMTNVEREYKSGDQRVKVSVMGGSGAGQALGGIAALGQMAAMMGGAQGSGQETFRIGGRTATLEDKGSRADLTVFLESGGMIKFEMSRGADAAKLRSMAEEFKIDELDGYLKGKA